jgi:epsilon-lactone hydrolase
VASHRWWRRPADADPDHRLLYMRGGGYGVGSASAFRNLASQIAGRAKAQAFVPDHRLAPGLTLALLPIVPVEGVVPAGAAVMSPWTDLGLTGASLDNRADADPIFTRGVLQAFADSYAQRGDKMDPKMSPLHAPLAGLPPIRIDVGEDKVLLDDSVRFAAGAAEAGVDVHLSIWEAFRGRAGSLAPLPRDRRRSRPRDARLRL